MQKKRIASILALVLGLISVAAAPKVSAQGTSTPEERARWAEITHKLESNPLDESVNKDGEWALNRLSDAHDIHVPLCPALLGEFNDAKYKYRPSGRWLRWRCGCARVAVRESGGRLPDRAEREWAWFSFPFHPWQRTRNISCEHHNPKTVS
jgi:hypothetical protein